MVINKKTFSSSLFMKPVYLVDLSTIIGILTVWKVASHKIQFHSMNILFFYDSLKIIVFVIILAFVRKSTILSHCSLSPTSPVLLSLPHCIDVSLEYVELIHTIIPHNILSWMDPQVLKVYKYWYFIIAETSYAFCAFITLCIYFSKVLEYHHTIRSKFNTQSLSLLDYFFII